jgi:hypothetical protein
MSFSIILRGGRPADAQYRRPRDLGQQRTVVATATIVGTEALPMIVDLIALGMRQAG